MLILITICFAMCFAAFAYLAGKSDSLIPNTVELQRLQASKGISFADFVTVNEKLGRKNISLSGESGGIIVEGVSNSKVVLVNENFFKCYGLKSSAGSLFDAAVIENCAPLAVISERTAMELFMTTDVLGNKIQIAGEPFLVVGLYDSESSYWENTAKDTADRIYIPYTSLYDGGQELVDAVSYEENQYTADYHNNLKSFFGRTINGYEKIDYELGKSMTAQFYSIFQWIIILVLCGYLLLFVYRGSRKILKDMQNFYQDTYFISAAKDLLKRDWLSILAVVAELGAIVFLLSVNRLAIKLPSAMIPADNVFDLKYYLDYFLQYAQSNNTVHFAANGFYKRLSENTLVACAAFLPICILLLFGVIRRAAAIACLNKWRFVEYFIWILLSCAVILGICFLSGFPFSMQTAVTCCWMIMLLLIVSYNKYYNANTALSKD
jgi:hypothetical protein